MSYGRERLYTLDSKGDPIPATDILEWGAWLEKADRLVSRTQIDDTTQVLTVFTGIDQAWSTHAPALWGTMVFGGPHHGLGQRDSTIMGARFGHSLWCEMARGKLAPERARLRSLCPTSNLIDHTDSRIECLEDGSLWLSRLEIYDLLRVDKKILSNYEQLGVLHPRCVRRIDPYPPRGGICYGDGSDKNPVYRTVIMYDALEIIAIARRNERPDSHSQRGLRLLPQQLKPAHAALLDFYVTPGSISQVEFRVRYGYRCKYVETRVRHRQNRYRVTRADGTIVCEELSAQQAWKTAYQREQSRLAPILIARDAIAEGRLADALLIANQLDPDLEVPLRREVAHATEASKEDLEAAQTTETSAPAAPAAPVSPAAPAAPAAPASPVAPAAPAAPANAARFVCRTCGQLRETWAPRCSNCFSLKGFDRSATDAPRPELADGTTQEGRQ